MDGHGRGAALTGVARHSCGPGACVPRRTRDRQEVLRVQRRSADQAAIVTRAVNGQGATTRGIELTARTALTFLPGWLSGFGVDTNYTRMGYKYSAGNELINSLDGSVLSYPGMSKNAYNASIWYDRGPINARVSYTYRDRFYTGGTDVSGNPTYQEKTGFLDAKIQYRYNDHITFSLEGKNLSNQAQTTDSGSIALINEIAWPGRRYFFSVSIAR